MKFNKKVSNAMLYGALEAMKENPTDEAREILLEEIIKGEYLCPTVISMEPVIGESGEPELPDGCMFSQQMLRDSKGRLLLMAFTSEEQMQRWTDRVQYRPNCYGFACTFLDYADLMLNELEDGSYGPAEGFVIDPYGANVVVDRDMMANILIRLRKRGGGN